MISGLQWLFQIATVNFVRLAVDKAWSSGYYHLINLHLELHRKKFSSVGERGYVASGMAPFLRSGNSFYGRLAGELSNSLYMEFAVKEEGLCSFWEEIWCLGIRF